jgi:soluble epoxide hydrolase/lipid-phosphate phosphatase
MILPRTPSLSVPFPTNLSNRLCFDISPSPNLLHVSQNESFTSLLYTSDYGHLLSFYPPGELEKWLAADKRLPQSSSILSEAETSIHNRIFSLHDQDGGGYRGPTNWYRALVGNINGADEEATIQAGALDPQIKCPVLAIDSAPSAASLPGFMEGTLGAFAKDLRFKKAKTKGHWVQIESRDEVNEWLEEFFREVGA